MLSLNGQKNPQTINKRKYIRKKDTISNSERPRSDFGALKTRENETKI